MPYFCFVKVGQHSFERKKKRGVILVAPLNWGLGHATRCIPIIKKLLKLGFEVVIASDSGALSLLKQEFPELRAAELPSYDISYTKKGRWFKLGLLRQMPRIIRVMRDEQRITSQLIQTYGITGIISDNRFGVRHKRVPCVFVTHQIQVLSGWSTPLTSWMHQRIIKKFDQCWVPDYPGAKALAGRLSQGSDLKFPVAYLGPISRMKKLDLNLEIDILIVLSGPEPQRGMLEKIMLEKFKETQKRVILVRGVIEETIIKQEINGLEVYNFQTSNGLERLINSSKLVIARSGYTTVMDLAKTQTPAFFIPTPGQYEQEYLAQRLSANLIAPYSDQGSFDLILLKQLKSYDGWPTSGHREKLKSLFGIFERK